MLTPTTATLTATTVNGEVTIPLRREGRTSNAIWRHYEKHSPRRSWQNIAPGIFQLDL